jgi:bacillithiol system protein YtxJ
MAEPREISTNDEVKACLEEPRAVLFKYGTHCPISAAARTQLAQFVERSPDAVVYQVAVDTHRDVSDYIAEKLGVPHASPQAFVVCSGDIAWQATHHSIQARALASQWDTAARGTARR